MSLSDQFVAFDPKRSDSALSDPSSKPHHAVVVFVIGSGNVREYQELLAWAKVGNDVSPCGTLSHQTTIIITILSITIIQPRYHHSHTTTTKESEVQRKLIYGCTSLTQPKEFLQQIAVLGGKSMQST